MQKAIVLQLLCFFLVHTASAQAPSPAFTADLTGGCSPLVVSFTDQSTGSPTSWFWDFGNGATSTLQNPSTTYFVAGTYTVTLTATNSNGSKAVTRAKYITVYGNPVVQFKGNDSIGCFPFPVQFTDLSLASAGTTNTSWVWDLGNGTQSSQQNPRLTYQNTGNYTVSLKVANDKGCWSVLTRPGYIRIDGGVAADFNFAQPISCHTPFDIRFTNASTGPGILSYTWDFGDGGTSTQATPTHTYTKAGVYTVVLVTKSSNGCTDTLRKVNLLNLQNTTTAFTAPDTVCMNNAVAFNNTSSAGALSTLWLFSDGSTSTVASPIKTFNTAGTYSVKLVQAYGICADSATKTIHVSPRPTAGFTTDKTASCQTPLNVNFQNTSANGVAYAWDFGDGATSTDVNPAHTYSTYGNFSVTLVVTNAAGCTDTLKMPGAIKVNKPTIRFSGLPYKGCLPSTVTFAADVTSPDPVSSYLWDMGNGTTFTSATPSFTYTQQGTYPVRLTITTANGCTETLSLADAVVVGRKPVVNFSAVPTTVCAYQKVIFSNQSNEGTSWLWDFGDGSTSGEKAPQHQYNDTGTFTVKLFVENNGCKDSLVLPKYITVKPPIARFDYKTSCTDKLNLAFNDKSIGATSWQWDFGDGTSSTERNPVHSFAAYGSYTVQLTVSNDTCFHQSKQIIKIGNGAPDFTASVPAVCHGSSIQFMADTTNAANIVSYRWNFGNDSILVGGTTASTVYNKAGNYTVTLTVKDSNGCLDSTVKPQVVQINGPTAGVQASNNIGCKGLQVTFNDASTEDGHSKIVQWQWDLGDGTVVNNPSPAAVQHFYAKAGAFNVKLKVSDEGGCTDSISLPALVKVSDIKADFVSADTVSCPGATIHFTNTSTALTAFTADWNFGDGTASAQQHPTTAYNADGLYTVQLKIKDGLGCTDSITKTNYISIKHPVAAYTLSDSATSCIPFQVKFTNTSTYYTHFLWDLGGGTSRLDSPIQYYNSPGVYKTKLVVTSPGGCTDSATKNITVYDISAAGVTYLPLNGCKPLTVQLNAFSPQKMKYVWDFGDGTILNSNDTTATHIYNFFGDFVPKVILKDPYGCVIPVTGLDTIRIKGATSKFGLDKKFFCDSGMVSFFDSTTFNNRIAAYHWDFGDGASSTQASPSHFYSKPGLYTVSLNVQTENLCVDTFRLSYPIKIVASPSIDIVGDTVICAGEGILHMGVFKRADTSLVRWAWTFPNGNRSAVQLPPRQYYKEAGRFAVEAIGVNSSGCKDTAYQHIVVNPIPSVRLPTTITTTIGTPVVIPAIYSDTMKTYQWSVPDGLNCPTCAQPMATPKLNTKYTVRFVDNNGCQNLGSVQVIVLCSGDNVFVPNTFSPNGDGSNDIFYVRGRGLSRVKTLRVFNRWGQVVFERNNFSVNDATQGWDGTFKGAKPQPGVYVYQVEIFCDNSQVVKFEGNVALVQ